MAILVSHGDEWFPTVNAMVQTFPATDGYALHYRHWNPRGVPRAKVVYLHGIQSHGGWYEISCRRLCDAGFEVFFLDRRGSGLNQVERGHAESWQQLVDDVVRFLCMVRGRETTEARRHADDPTRSAGGEEAKRVRDGDPDRASQPSPCSPASVSLGLPVLLLAVSWGGKLAAAVAAQAGELIDGLGLLYPDIGARIRPRWYQVLALHLACRLGLGRREVKIPLDDPALFTRSPHWQRFLAEDPLSLRRASVSFLNASHQLDLHLRGLAAKIHTPTLMMQAGNDRIIDNEATQKFFEQLASPEKNVIVYPQAQHTLEFEPDPEPFLRDLVNWLEKRVAKCR